MCSVWTGSTALPRSKASERRLCGMNKVKIISHPMISHRRQEGSKMRDHKEQLRTCARSAIVNQLNNSVENVSEFVYFEYIIKLLDYELIIKHFKCCIEYEFWHCKCWYFKYFINYWITNSSLNTLSTALNSCVSNVSNISSNNWETNSSLNALNSNFGTVFRIFH